MNSRVAQDRSVEVGVFPTVDSTAHAVKRLLDAGFTKDQITVVCSDEAKKRHFAEFEHQEPAGTYAPKATAAGGTIGALLGAAAVVVPAVATGSVVFLAAGGAAAWAGGVAGGLVGAMMTRGVEKEIANYYQQAVLDQNLLVAVDVGDPSHHAELAQAARIIAEAGADPIPLRAG
jgi:hypothetical protein